MEDINTELFVMQHVSSNSISAGNSCFNLLKHVSLRSKAPTKTHEYDTILSKAKPELPEIGGSEDTCCITKKSWINVLYPTKNKFLGKQSLSRGGISFLTGGSFSTSRLNFHIPAFKSVILFLFDFLKISCLGEKDSHFCLVYAKVY